MVEKELKVVTLDNIKLVSAYVLRVDGREVTFKTAFSEKSEQKKNLFGHSYKVGDLQNYPPTLTKDVRSLGCSISIDLLHEMNIDIYGTLEDLRGTYPQIYKVLKRRIPKDFFTEINKGVISTRDTMKAKIQKQYDELLEVFMELGTKRDIATMQDIDDLLYCEASTFMDDIEKRINKKSNPKNLKLYKALQTLRKNSIIECA